jgi:hypothetical protein
MPNMRKLVSILVLPAVALGGCSLFKGRSAAPDEFAVARNAPLVIPPDYTLTPPVAGTAALSPQDAQQQAIDALFGGPAPRSASETSLLDTAGRGSAQLGIRSQVWDPSTRLVDKGPTTVQILTAQNSSTNVASAQPGQ